MNTCHHDSFRTPQLRYDAGTFAFIYDGHSPNEVGANALLHAHGIAPARLGSTFPCAPLRRA